MQLRGSGEFLGTQQTGYRQYKIADLQRDKGLLEAIAQMAKQLLHEQPVIALAIAKRWLGDFERFLQT